jgi:phospholipid N-methyltransferase
MQALQQSAYPIGHNYRAQSAHLKHRQIYEFLLRNMRDVLADLKARGLGTRLLEIGAGDGGFSEPALAYGCRVTVTEMSLPSYQELQGRYGGNEYFEALFDEDGSLSVVGDRQFTGILYASVLHHIPDYIGAINKSLTHLAPGGSFMSFQDPLWYPSVKRPVRWFNRSAYLLWRASRGNYARGVGTLLRRARKTYDVTNPSDMVEYHVVRNGVNHELLFTELNKRFEQVEIFTYWSTPSAFWQRIGERLGLRTTFGIVAKGYLGNGGADR